MPGKLESSWQDFQATYLHRNSYCLPCLSLTVSFLKDFYNKEGSEQHYLTQTFTSHNSKKMDKIPTLDRQNFQYENDISSFFYYSCYEDLGHSHP